jgi:predicted enzyme related to lactoylglutathione lyase
MSKATLTKTPSLFRITVHVRGVGPSQVFYEALLGTKGRQVGGGRCYFDCGPSILALLEAPKGRAKAGGNLDALYFSVDDLEAAHRRAKKLACLSDEDVHGESGAVIATRPWGERSFYAKDPSGNSLCFVERGTEFTGRR